MARKPASTNRTPATAKESTTEPPDSKRAPTLTTLRGEIDQLDQDLVGLLNRRAEIASQIGQIKHHQGLEIWSAAREDEVI
ncbi:MAG TPA: chorismate mutase, partial [Isosphaeraceae bacterium]|nr:chorismate mutase [Isosphaeraceae bacterium]